MAVSDSVFPSASEFLRLDEQGEMQNFLFPLKMYA